MILIHGEGRGDSQRYRNLRDAAAQRAGAEGRALACTGDKLPPDGSVVGGGGSADRAPWVLHTPAVEMWGTHHT